MLLLRLALGVIVATLVASCSKRQDAPQRADDTRISTPADAGQPLLDPCTLLTSEEIASVQGEPVKETRATQETAGGLAIVQCHFALPTYANSINLRVVQKASGPEGREPRQVWNETFTPEHIAQAGRRAPEMVPDIGEEAFWRSDRKSGTLHVLKGNRYIRVGIGGPDNRDTKIRKCSELARAVLARL